MKVQAELEDGNSITGTVWLDVTLKGNLAFCTLENCTWQARALIESAGAEFWHDGKSYSLLDCFTTYGCDETRFGFSKGGLSYGY